MTEFDRFLPSAAESVSPSEPEYTPIIPTLGEPTTGLQQELLVEQYRRDRFVPISGLLDLSNAAALLAATEDVPAYRVRVSGNTDTWDEQNFDPNHPAYQFFEQDILVGFIRTLTGLKRVNQLMAWTSIYRLGEYINPHTDSAGSTQLLVCLKAPRSPEQGGKLVVGGQELFLTPGDAIAFEATSLEHCTTPLIATKDEPEPRRVVLVGRYFMS
jgi:hypothetical protein